MIVDKLIRSYYEVNGSFKGIESQVFYQKCRDKSEDYLYQCLGYISGGDLTAKQRYEYRKLFCQGKKRDLSRKLNVTSKDLPRVLKQLECLATTMKKVRKTKNIELAKLLGMKYENNHDIFTINKSMRDMVIELREFTNSKDIQEYLSKAEQLINENTPQFIPNSPTNKIVGRNFYVENESLTDKEINDICFNAIMVATFRVDKITMEARNISKSILKKGLESIFETDIESYMLLLDVCHTFDLTVKELCVICAEKYIDYVSMYKDCEATIDWSRLDKEFIVNNDLLEYGVNCNRKALQFLYERDLLKTLEHKNGVLVVYNDGYIPVRKYSPVTKYNTTRVEM